MRVLDIPDLKQAMADELERRRCAGRALSFAQQRGGTEALYGLIGAVNILAAIGLPLGGRRERAATAARILAGRDEHGRADGGSGSGHAAHMIIGALNLLGEPIPEDISPLAPTDPDELSVWIERHDWRSTHKELCGQTIPLLASGRVRREWTDAFARGVSARLHPDRHLETWCAADAPPWRVVSCVFHVLSAFDAGRLPYPQPERIMQRLLHLHWDKAPDSEPRTICTDGDWAWLLLRLHEHVPQHGQQVMEAIRCVSARRVRAWHSDREAILSITTHELYCYLWSTAVFQSCVREHYIGGYLRDTFNDPALFRLGEPFASAEGR